MRAASPTVGRARAQAGTHTHTPLPHCPTCGDGMEAKLDHIKHSLLLLLLLVISSAPACGMND